MVRQCVTCIPKRRQPNSQNYWINSNQIICSKIQIRKQTLTVGCAPWRSLLVLSELSGSEATQFERLRFAVAVTNQNAVGRAAHVKAVSESSDDLCDMEKTVHHPISLFWLVAANGYWVTSRPFSPHKIRSVEMRWAEVRFVIRTLKSSQNWATNPASSYYRSLLSWSKYPSNEFKMADNRHFEK